MHTKRGKIQSNQHKMLIPLLLLTVLLLLAYLFILGDSREETAVMKTSLTSENQKVHFLATCQKIEAFHQQKGFYPDPDQMVELTAHSNLHYQLFNQDVFELQLQSEQGNLVYRSDIDKIKQLMEQKARIESR